MYSWHRAEISLEVTALSGVLFDMGISSVLCLRRAGEGYFGIRISRNESYACTDLRAFSIVNSPCSVLSQAKTASPSQGTHARQSNPTFRS